MTESTCLRRARTFAFRVRDNFHGVFLRTREPSANNAFTGAQHTHHRRPTRLGCVGLKAPNMFSPQLRMEVAGQTKQAIGKGKRMLTKPHERLQPGHGAVSESQYTHLAPGSAQASVILLLISSTPGFLLQNERSDTINASASNTGRERERGACRWDERRTQGAQVCQWPHSPSPRNQMCVHVISTSLPMCKRLMVNVASQL